MLPIPTHLREILATDAEKYNGNSLEGQIRCDCGCENIKLKIYVEEHKNHIAVNEYKDKKRSEYWRMVRFYRKSFLSLYRENWPNVTYICVVIIID